MATPPDNRAGLAHRVAHRSRQAASLAVAGALSSSVLAACGRSSPSPASVAAAFAAAVARGDYPAAASLVVAPPADFAATYAAAVSDLDAATGLHPTTGTTVAHGSHASVPLSTTVDAGAYGTLVLHSTLSLVTSGGRWKVAWSPSAIDPALGPGDHFAVRTTWPTRAAVLGAGGASLTPAGAEVGLVGQRITDPTLVRTLLVGAGLAGPAVDAALAQADRQPTQFTPVGVLPQAVIDAARASAAGGGAPNLYSVAGTAFTPGAQAPLTQDLATHVLGTVGPITAEQLRSLGAPYDTSSVVGQGGIEAAYERTLAGRPEVEVSVRNASGQTVAAVATRPSTAGTPVVTTLDPVVQQAAESAMSALPAGTQAAMVVMRASTGGVLASVSEPTTQAFDVALDGQVPPGSTFKVVTSTALLLHGDTDATPATCPSTRTVNGQTFHNFEGEASPTLDLATAFAVSCNTAFIGLTAGLPDTALPDAAALYGLGRTPRPGVAVAGSSVPTPSSPNELAGASIGQSTIVVSPLAMASVAATVDSGSYRPPQLVAGAPDDSLPAQPLPAGIAGTLRALMAGVTTGDGTAAGAGLPPGTYGKTGTAEYGSGPNPPTHAWFIGFRGDIAFAVFVYGGGVGGKVAAPLAARLLDALPAGY